MQKHTEVIAKWLYIFPGNLFYKINCKAWEIMFFAMAAKIEILGSLFFWWAFHCNDMDMEH